MALERRVDYHPPGPVARAFLRSDAFVVGIRGPIGSGKSTACAMKLVRGAQKQTRGADGWIRRRSAVIRNSYPELKTTTIKTWHQWVPPTTGHWRDNGPPAHRIVDESNKFDWEIMFIALDRPDDVRKLLSMELSDAWINEAKEIPRAILDGLTGRVGRYPPTEKDANGEVKYGCVDPQIMMDTNPPDTDHWWYRMAEDPSVEDLERNKALEEQLQKIGALRPGQPLLQWFAQPGGEHPEAENLDHLPPGYYLKAKANKKPEWIKVYVDGNYGFVLDGKAVYSEYADATHCKEFDASPRIGLEIGLDFGLTPAAVFAQKMPNGQWRKDSELVTENMGIVRFAEVFKAHLATVYRGFVVNNITGDPAGDIRAQTDEKTPFDILKAGGVMARPAHSNDPVLRIESVSAGMRRMIDGAPGLLIHPRCRMLRKAYAGGYNYRRMQITGTERYADKPNKDMHSHVADADQYLMLGAGEGKAIIRGDAPRAPRPTEVLSDYNVFEY